MLTALNINFLIKTNINKETIPDNKGDINHDDT